MRSPGVVVMPEPLEPGDPQQVGEYWLAGRLGAGSQGVVYEAYAEDGARVAVKVLYTDQSSGELRRLGREVRAAQRVASFCTARILEAHLEGSSPFIVSEYVEGVSLGRAVREGRRFCGDDLHRLAVGIATALTAVHEAGVVHRDLKPDNVLLGPDGPRVIDFGVARTAEMSLTAPGTLSGTPRYMAPEVVGMQPAGAPADVFAWGAIVLFAATGEHAFGAPSIAAVLQQVLTAHPDLSALPESLRGLVGAALAKDPLARPSARTILSALTRAPAVGPQDLLAAGSAQAGLLAAGDPIDPTLSAVAEAAYTALTGREQALVPEILLRLVAVGEDGGISTRAVPRDELCDRADPDDREAVEAVLAAFGALLVQTGGQVMLAWPAVFRAWPRLRGWLDAHRGSLPVHHRIREAARDWDQHGRRRTDVLAGRRLEETLVWVTAGHPPALNRMERAFVNASTEARTRAVRRRRAVTAALAVLVVVASGAAALALGAAASATRAEHQAARQRDIAISAQLIARSQELSGVDPTLSQKLSIAAWRLHPSPEARHAMLNAATRPLTATLTGHTAPVLSVAFGPRGRILATAGHDHTVRLWDAATRRPLHTPLIGHTDKAASAAFSPDGRILATGGHDRTVRLWDVASRRQIGAPLTGFGKGVGSVAFSPDGRTLAIGSWDGTIRLWDMTTRRLAGAPSAGSPEGIVSVAFNPDGRTLAIGSWDGTVRLWDVAAWRQLGAPLSGRTDPGWSVAFSPDGRTLATGGFRSVQLWDVATRRLTGTLPTGNTTEFAPVVFSPDGRTLAAGSDSTVQLWDVAARRRVGAPLTDHTDLVTAVVFSPDGRTLATGSCDHTVGLWDITTRQQIDPPEPRLSARAVREVLSVAFSPDRRTLATGSGDRTVRLWDVTARRQIGGPLTGHTGPVASVVFSPDGRTLATTSRDQTVRLWDVATGRQTATIDLRNTDLRPGNNDACLKFSAVAFSPDGRVLAASDADCTVRLWDTATRRLFGTPLTGPADGTGVRSMTFSPDGRTLAAGSGDGMVRLWNAATYAPIGAPLAGHTNGVRSVVFSPDGRTLATSGFDNGVRLWDVTAHRQIGRPLFGHTNGVRSVVFSPDGRTLATSSRDQTVRLWDVATHRQIGSPLVGHGAPVASMVFSPDGRTLTIGTKDAVAVQWKVNYLTDVVSWLCARAGGALTPREWSRHVPAGPAYREICP